MADAAGPKVRTVGDVMSSPAVTATTSESLADVSARMQEHLVGSVVVVDGSRPVGILTERDLVRFAATGGDSLRVKVSEWMTEGPSTIGPKVEVREAWNRLSEKGYRHIPVVADTGELLGIVSMRDLMRVAQLQPLPGSAIDVPQGLKGVVVTETEVGDVRGYEGFYHYRQYSAIDLAEQRTLECVWHLLFEGELPTAAQRDRFIEEIAPLRRIPDVARPVLPAIAEATELPLDGLRTAVSLIAAASGMRPNIDIDRTTLRANAMQISAVVPTLLTALHRLREGQEPIEPRDDLGYAANYLYMLTGEEPEPDKARAIEQYLISTVDHGFNASTFTARVVASTGADLGACVTAAIGSLSGPWHGGAPSRALDTLDDIGTIDNVDAWIRPRIEAGDKIMGFGHPVYRTDDPRSTMLRGVAERLGGDNVEFAKTVERRIVEILNEVKPGRHIYTNVEYYAGVVMELCGLPRNMFTPTFASSRVIGWCANILEQAAHNKIIRPAARYVGPPPPEPVPALDEA
ncbi:MAG TPA: citrate synthase [Acidimicrobiales bacterium]